MADFIAKAAATYRDFDFDSNTPQTLVTPSAWTDPGDYDPDWFESNDLFKLTNREIGYDRIPAGLSRQEKALARYEIWLKNEFFGYDGAPTTIDETEVRSDGTLVAKGPFGTYYGVITIEGQFFVVVSGTSNSFTLYGTIDDDGFRFPETLDGQPDPTDISTIPYRPDMSTFTPRVDRWSGDGSDDVAGLLGGSDVAKGKGGHDVILGHGGGDRIYGGNGNDDLFGNAGRDDLYGGTGKDLLIGGNDGDFIDPGKGRDIMIGGKGHDDFIFKDGYGNNTIRDFNANSNKEDIDLSDVTEITGFRDLKRFHMIQNGDDVVIDDYNGTGIILKNVDIDDLQKFDFIF